MQYPSLSQIYVFGSYLRSDAPADIDLLIVYDISECLPSEAHQRHKALLQEIQARFRLQVHAILLTQREESEIAFVSDTEAVPLDTIQNERSI